MDNAAIPNHALQPFAKLIGEWKTSGTHPLVPNTILHGHSSFKWIEGGAFLSWHSRIDFKGFPSGIAIFGSDDDTDRFYLLYFDERNVSRKYDVSYQPGVLRWWRNAPNFSQRYTWTFDKDEDDIDIIVGKGELSLDGTSWNPDLDLTFTRIS